MSAEDADPPLDPASAADLIAQTDRRSRQALRLRLWTVYAAWGLAWFVGCGSLWMSARHQQRYVGPRGWAYAVLAVLMVVAVGVTAYQVMASSRGVHGASRRQSTLYGLAWPVAMVLTFGVSAAVSQHGSDAVVSGIVAGTAAPIATSVIYLVGSAIWSDTTMFVIGVWLALVTVAAAFAGPPRLLLIESVAAGGGFAVAAIVSRAAHR